MANSLTKKVDAANSTTTLSNVHSTVRDNDVSPHPHSRSDGLTASSSVNKAGSSKSAVTRLRAPIGLEGSRTFAVTSKPYRKQVFAGTRHFRTSLSTAIAHRYGNGCKFRISARHGLKGVERSAAVLTFSNDKNMSASRKWFVVRAVCSILDPTFSQLELFFNNFTPNFPSVFQLWQEGPAKTLRELRQLTPSDVGLLHTQFVNMYLRQCFDIWLEKKLDSIISPCLERFCTALAQAAFFQSDVWYKCSAPKEGQAPIN